MPPWQASSVHRFPSSQSPSFTQQSGIDVLAQTFEEQLSSVHGFSSSQSTDELQLPVLENSHTGPVVVQVPSETVTNHSY